MAAGKTQAQIQRRKILLEKFGRLFKKYPSNHKRCVYCGLEVGITIDHVPPLSSIDDLGTAYFEREGIALWLVNSCLECNLALGNREWMHTITDRRKFIGEYLQKKYRRAIEGAAWSEDELAELGPGLQKYVREHSDNHTIATRRVRWATGF